MDLQGNNRNAYFLIETYLVCSLLRSSILYANHVNAKLDDAQTRLVDEVHEKIKARFDQLKKDAHAQTRPFRYGMVFALFLVVLCKHRK